MSPFRACEYDDDALRRDPTLRTRLCEWVRSLGLNPDELLPEAVVVMGESEYELHVSKQRRKADGSLWVDYAQGAVVSEPLIVPIGTDHCWPEPQPLHATA